MHVNMVCNGARGWAHRGALPCAPARPGPQALPLAGRPRTPREGKLLTSRASLSPLQVARQLQPSVVWIQDTEKTFYKKVPNTEKMVRAPLCSLV